MASLSGLSILTQANTLAGQYINAQTGTTYEFVLLDAGALVTCSNAGAIAVTVPTNTNVAYEVGTKIYLANIGAGQVTVAGDTGVTVSDADGLTLDTDEAGMLWKLGTNTWLFVKLSSSGGGGYDEGTSFPVSPSTDDKFYRTDRNILYFYDGTQWLTVQQFAIHLSAYRQLPATGYSATNTRALMGVPPGVPTYDFYIEEWRVDSFVFTTNNGTNHWTMSLVKDDTAGARTTVDSFNTSTHSNDLHTRTVRTVNALLGTTNVMLNVDIPTKTLSPGNLVVGASLIVGRLVG